METKVYLCDIEGTTTDILFVKNCLFPYARQHVREFLSSHFNDESIKKIIGELYLLSARDGKPIDHSDDKETFLDSIVQFVEVLIDEDRKVPELKNLQGKIWKVAFENGSIKGHVYSDVASSFQRWFDSGHKICIYSSGSIEAQKLLFANSEFGDLTKFISGYFDTTNAGPKQEVQSYQNILTALKTNPGNILFLSDIPGEVIAALESGMHVTILDRPNNPTNLTDDLKIRFKIVKSFDEIA